MPAAPPRWQSSQRPLFVRTVWVNGMRHAILSADDPLLQYVPLTSSRPSTTSSSSSSRSSTQSSSSIINLRRYRIEDCLVKLKLANTIASGKTYPQAFDDNDDEDTVRTRNYIDEAVYRIRNNNVGNGYQQNCYDDSCDNVGLRLPRLGEFIRPLSFYEQHKSEDTSEEAMPPELQDNQLSERVLQWLDLSGKSKRLHTPVTRPGSDPSVPVLEAAQKRDTQQLPTPTEPRRPYSVRKKDIPLRGPSVDISRNFKYNDSPKSRQHVDIGCKHRDDDNFETCTLKARPYSPPTVQNYETTSKLRAVTAWPQASASATANRPQLHIFMPPIDNDDGDNTNAGRLHDDISEYGSITSDASK